MMDARISSRCEGMMRAGRWVAIAVVVASAAGEKAQAQPGGFVNGSALQIYLTNSSEYLYVGSSGNDVYISIGGVFGGVPDGGEDMADSITSIFINCGEGYDTVDLYDITNSNYPSLDDVYIYREFDDEDDISPLGGGGVATVHEYDY